MIQTVRYHVVGAAILMILSVQVALGRTQGSWFPKGKNRSMQFQRRIQHILSGFIIIYYQRNARTSEFAMVMTISTLAVILIHLARLYSSLVQWFFVYFFHHILRDTEKQGKRVPGALYFLLGNWLAFYLYSRNFCSLAILAVTVGDPIAGIVGAYFVSSRLVGKKTVAGTLGCALLSGVILTIAASVWGQIPEHIPNAHALAFLILGVITALSELFAVVDDNLTMPILFGACFRLSIFAAPALPSAIAQVFIEVYYA